MEKAFKKIIRGYRDFRKNTQPAIMQKCDPGDLFVFRNVANIVPPYKADESHHSMSAGLEFSICYLNVKHLIILGHSQYGGINFTQQ